MNLAKINYEMLNARQQEVYNFHKVAAVLADYGFTCQRLNDDWQGADFIALHVDGETVLRVQLKDRLAVDKKYVGKNIWITFRSGGNWYLYPHDEILGLLIERGKMTGTKSWDVGGSYAWPGLSAENKEMLAGYIIGSDR